MIVSFIQYEYFKVCKSDPLPNHVCIDCWTKLEQFHEFHQSVHTAQANYLSRIVKNEQENGNNDVLDALHLNIDDESIDPIANVCLVEEENAIKIEYDDGLVNIKNIESHDEFEYDERLDDDNYEFKSLEQSDGESNTFGQSEISGCLPFIY